MGRNLSMSVGLMPSVVRFATGAQMFSISSGAGVMSKGADRRFAEAFADRVDRDIADLRRSWREGFEHDVQSVATTMNAAEKQTREYLARLANGDDEDKTPVSGELDASAAMAVASPEQVTDPRAEAGRIAEMTMMEFAAERARLGIGIPPNRGGLFDQIKTTKG
jgi:hypothetical protein